MKHLIIRLLTGLIVFLLMLEGLLRLFDPLGVSYFPNIEYLDHFLELSATRGFALSPGNYSLRGWRISEQAHGARAIPDNSGGACTLLFVGDSVAWSEGVDDNAAWVDLVARQLPGVNVVNGALYAYNSENVRGTIQEFPDARAIIYLVIINDPEVMRPYKASSPGNFSATLYYLYYLLDFPHYVEPPNDWSRFYRDMDAMHADGRVTFVAFDAPFGRDLATRYSVQLIPPWTHNISRVDGHANAEGNQQIAVGMLPIAQSVVKDKCGG